MTFRVALTSSDSSLKTASARSTDCSLDAEVKPFCLRGRPRDRGMFLRLLMALSPLFAPASEIEFSMYIEKHRLFSFFYLINI
jgi:hypothetical protein